MELVGPGVPSIPPLVLALALALVLALALALALALPQNILPFLSSLTSIFFCSSAYRW